MTQRRAAQPDLVPLMKRNMTAYMTVNGFNMVLVTRSKWCELGHNTARRGSNTLGQIVQHQPPPKTHIMHRHGSFILPPTRVSPHLVTVEVTTCCELWLHTGVYRPSALTLVLNSMGCNLQPHILSQMHTFKVLCTVRFTAPFILSIYSHILYPRMCNWTIC